MPAHPPPPALAVPPLRLCQPRPALGGWQAQQTLACGCHDNNTFAITTPKACSAFCQPAMKNNGSAVFEWEKIPYSLVSSVCSLICSGEARGTSLCSPVSSPVDCVWELSPLATFASPAELLVPSWSCAAKSWSIRWHLVKCDCFHSSDTWWQDKILLYTYTMLQCTNLGKWLKLSV